MSLKVFENVSAELCLNVEDNLSRKLARCALRYIRGTGVCLIATEETLTVSGTFEQVKEAYVNVSQSANGYNNCSLITVTCLQLNKCITD